MLTKRKIKKIIAFFHTSEWMLTKCKIKNSYSPLYFSMDADILLGTLSKLKHKKEICLKNFLYFPKKIIVIF